MPKHNKTRRTQALKYYTTAKMPWGITWGLIAGLIIGTGISLNIDLFFTASSQWVICAVVVLFSLLGGLLGYLTMDIYTDSIMLMNHSEGSFQIILPFVTSVKSRAITPISELKKTSDEISLLPLVESHSNIAILETVVAAAYAASQINRKSKRVLGT